MSVTLAAPDPGMLQELTKRLERSMGPNAHERQEAMEWLLKARNDPDFSIYLAALTVIDDTVVAPATRQYAGLVLKDLVRTGYPHLPQSHQDIIRQHIPLGLTSTTTEVQMVCGDVIAAVVCGITLAGWPGLIEFLVELAQSQRSIAAAAAIRKITEDAYSGVSDLDLVALASLFSSDVVDIRRSAIMALNTALSKEDSLSLVFPGPITRARLYECILEAVLPLQKDSDGEIHKCLCQIYTLIYGLSSTISEKILVHFKPTIDYIIGVHRHSTFPDAVREAAEFWLHTADSPEFLGGELGSQPEMISFLTTRFDDIVALLLGTMRYSDEQAYELEAAEAKEAEEDVNKPVFARSRYNVRDLSDGEEDEDEDEDEADAAWTVRKCSAAALDVLATSFPTQVAPRVTAYFQQDFDRSSWRDAEVRVLALGAIAEGCKRAMFAHVGELGSVLQPFMGHPTATVRQITCWTLSRYACYFSEYGVEDPVHQQVFGSLLDSILGLLGDNSPLVQSAATSALVTVEQRLQSALIPYAGSVASHLQTCFGRYRGKAMWLLYDCVQTLADHLGAALSQPSVVEPLMGALLHRQAELSLDSHELLPLIETLVYIATAIGPDFGPFAEQQWTFCCTLLSTFLSQLGAEDIDPGTPPSSSGAAQFLVAMSTESISDMSDTFFDKLVVALDLLASMMECVPEQATNRFLPLTPGFFRIVAACSNVPNKDVRQSAQALVGECSIHAFSMMQPIVVPFFEQVIVPQLAHDVSRLKIDPWLAPVVSNSCWVIGEVVRQQTTGLEQFIPSLCESIVPLLHMGAMADSLQENAVISIGRLGFGYAQFVEHLLSTQLETFVKQMIQVQWTGEKASGMQGLCRTLIQHSQPIDHYSIWVFFQHLMTIPDQFLNMQSPEGESVQKTFHDVLYAYKSYPPLTPRFNAFMTESFSPNEAHGLDVRFSLTM